jgi:hypothetical protein
MFHVRSLICVLLIVLLLLLADKSSGLELIMPDGTAGHYEGERNERGEPHGRGRVLNARGEAVAGDTWVDGAQEGECQSRQLLVDTCFLHVCSVLYHGSHLNSLFSLLCACCLSV